MPTAKKKEPKLMAFEITAVIPTAPYANIQPKLIYEAPDFETAYAAAMPQLERISNEYGSEKLVRAGVDNTMAPVTREELVCYLSGDIAYYDEAGHTYLDTDGNKLMSGSTFGHQFTHPFEKHLFIDRSATKLELTTEEVDAYWKSKGDISTTFGTALHMAMEHYGKWFETCERDIDSKTKQSKGTGIHPTLLPIVESFFKAHEDEEAVYEPFVMDKKTGRCGRIDRLVLVDKKERIVDIDDYKTNGDLYKTSPGPKFLKAPYANLPNVPLSTYMLQLSFYKAIVEAHGYTVRNLRVHWWNGVEWKTIIVKSVDIDKPQEKIDLSKVI